MQTSRERQKTQFKKASRRRKRVSQGRKCNNSDAARLFRFVLQQLTQYLPDIMVEHRLTLAMMMTGLLRGRDGRLAQMAEKVVYPHKKPSLVSRFERFVKSSWVEVDPYYLPLAQEILQAVTGLEPIVLLIDSTKLGGNCLCLMVSVYYKKRALPLAWHCFKGKKGHGDQASQIELLQRVQAMLPADTPVVLVGDGEFDGADLLTWLKTATAWQFVCRTTATTLVYYQDKWLSLTEVVADLGLTAGYTAFLSQVTFIRSQPVDQLNIFIAWHSEDQTHLFFVTNCATAAEASHWYNKRFTIETCFGDFKGRGLFLQRTRIRHPDRLDRLIFVAAGTYYLIIRLGLSRFFPAFSANWCAPMPFIIVYPNWALSFWTISSMRATLFPNLLPCPNLTSLCSW